MLRLRELLKPTSVSMLSCPALAKFSSRLQCLVCYLPSPSLKSLKANKFVSSDERGLMLRLRELLKPTSVSEHVILFGTCKVQVQIGLSAHFRL